MEWRNHEENLFGFFRCSQETNGRKRREKKRGGYFFVILPWVSAFDTAANKAKATPTTTSVGQPAMKENLLERIFGLDVKKMWAKPPRRHSGKTSFSGEFLFVCLFSLSPTFLASISQQQQRVRESLDGAEVNVHVPAVSRWFLPAHFFLFFFCCHEEPNIRWRNNKKTDRTHSETNKHCKVITTVCQRNGAINIKRQNDSRLPKNTKKTAKE